MGTPNPGTKPFSTNVMGFESREGVAVPHHTILNHGERYFGSLVMFVGFRHFDLTADMRVDVLVHWTEFTKYVHRSPLSHSPEFVLLENGLRIHTTHFSPSHYDREAWQRAPVLCQQLHRISTLDRCSTLLEIEGVQEWCYSKRRPEDASLIPNRIEERNAAFRARMEANHAHHTQPNAG